MRHVVSLLWINTSLSPPFCLLFLSRFTLRLEKPIPPAFHKLKFKRTLESYASKSLIHKYFQNLGWYTSPSVRCIFTAVWRFCLEMNTKMREEDNRGMVTHRQCERGLSGSWWSQQSSRPHTDTRSPLAQTTPPPAAVWSRCWPLSQPGLRGRDGEREREWHEVHCNIWKVSEKYDRK